MNCLHCSDLDGFHWPEESLSAQRKHWCNGNETWNLWCYLVSHSSAQHILFLGYNIGCSRERKDGHRHNSWKQTWKHQEWDISISHLVTLSTPSAHMQHFWSHRARFILSHQYHLHTWFPCSHKLLTKSLSPPLQTRSNAAFLPLA